MALKPLMLDETAQRMAASLEQLALHDVGSYQAAQQAQLSAQQAQQSALQAEQQAAEAVRHLNDVNKKVADLQKSLQDLPDGQSVSVQVANNTTAIQALQDGVQPYDVLAEVPDID